MDDPHEPARTEGTEEQRRESTTNTSAVRRGRSRCESGFNAIRKTTGRSRTSTKVRLFCTVNRCVGPFSTLLFIFNLFYLSFPCLKFIKATGHEALLQRGVDEGKADAPILFGLYVNPTAAPGQSTVAQEIVAIQHHSNLPTPYPRPQPFV